MRNVLSAMLVFAAVVTAQTNPVVIDQAIREALDRNLDLIASRYQLPIAETRMITAKLRPNPVVTVTGEHLDMLGTGFTAANQAGPNEFSYRTDFVLERGRKRDARMELAAGDREMARLNVLSAARDVITSVQNAFLDVQLAKESLQLADENLKALNAIVEVNGTRVKSGDLAPVELSRSRVAALQFQSAVQQARIRLTEAKNRLQLLMGRTPPTMDFDIAGAFRRDTVSSTPDELIQRAVARRPDYLAVKATQARSQADLRLQLAQGRIDYTVGTEYRRQQGINGTGNSLGFFFSAPLPVWNRNQGEIARAQRELEQTEARIRAIEASIRSEITSALQHYESSRQLLDQVENTMIQQAQQVRKVTEYSYRRGEASLVEFLDAQRAFNDTMQTYNEARADYARTLYLIDALTGAQSGAGEITR